MDKGTCQKHGEFILTEGCHQCLEEKRGEPVTPETGRADGQRVIFIDKKKGETLIAPLALRPGEDIEAHGYHAEAIKLLKYADARIIATVEDVKLATDDLSIISKLKKAMDGKKREYLDPLKAQSDAIRGTYDYLMHPIEEADRITRDKMLIYQNEQKRIRQEQEKINQMREEAAQKQKELTGEITEVETVEVVPEAPKRVHTEMGTAGQRDNWTYEVFDFSLLPDEYKVVDTSMLNAVAKKHHDQKPVPGVRFINKPIIAVRAR